MLNNRMLNKMFIITNILRLLLDDNCIYCGEADSIDHSFINCQFTRSFYQKVLQWFNTTHNSTFSLTTEEFLFGIPTAFTTLLKKINYTIMFLRYYIYKRKLQNDSLLLPDFINKIIYKYKIEKLILWIISLIILFSSLSLPTPL